MIITSWSHFKTQDLHIQGEEVANSLWRNRSASCQVNWGQWCLYCNCILFIFNYNFTLRICLFICPVPVYQPIAYPFFCPWSMPNASCTFQITPPLIIINRKITFERTILWASLYPRLVWGFPPSSAAWWANASDFAQSASWKKYFDCFGVWDFAQYVRWKILLYLLVCWSKTVTFPHSVLPFLYLLYISCFLFQIFCLTLFLSPLFAPAAFMPSSIFSKTLGTPTNLAMIWSTWQNISSVIVLKCQPAWSVVLYVFEQGSSQSVLVSKATRPTLEKWI